MAVVCMFIDTNYMEFVEEVAKVKVVKMKMVKNCKNCRYASQYLFIAHGRPDIQLSHNEVYERMLYVMYDAVVCEESMVETEAHEAVVYDEMSMFPTSKVLVLYPSCPDVAQDELPVVKSLYPALALDELFAVEDLFALVNTTGSAMPYYLIRPGENIFTASST